MPRHSSVSGLFVALLLGVNSHLLAQSPEPIFESTDDSLRYNRIRTSITLLFNTTGPSDSRQEIADSLTQELAKIPIRGYRYTYYPDDTYVQYKDLRDGEIAPEEIDKLAISDYSGKTLPEEVFQCANLKALQLVNTRIEIVPKKLNKLPNLTAIEIYNNRPLKRLRFGKNRSVTYLKIRGDAPHTLPKSYRKLSSLDSLDLARNLMEKFPKVTRNKNLKQLLLSENNLTLTDLHRKGNATLENLFLRKNNIVKVPDAIRHFPNLRKLTFNYNAITEVSPAIGSLKELQELSFYHNQLKTIPTGVYQLPQLRFVDLYFNQIERVEEDIRNLTSLRVLYLSNNRLINIPESIGALTHLRELYLHHNRLSFLPKSLGQLKELRVLRINENSFVSFPEEVLKLSALENLDISRNQFRELPEEIKKLKNLKLFALTDNPWEDSDDILSISRTFESQGAIVHVSVDN